MKPSSAGEGGSGTTGTGGSIVNDPVGAGGSVDTGGTTGTGGSGSGATGTAGVTGAGTAGSTGAGAASSVPTPTMTGSAGTTGGGGSGQPPQSGLLTAGAWDDNLNFDFYLQYLKQREQAGVAGLPRIPRATRMEIRVSDGSGAPLGGARVVVSDAAGEVVTAPTRSDGRLFVFPEAEGAQEGDEVQITVTSGAASATAAAHVGDASVSVALPGTTAAAPRALDLALVIDTTGSMQDEIDYLKVEVSDIAARIAADFPNVMQRWALILYRDVGDAYVVRSFDFTASLPTFQTQLAAQMAGGGGDYPEAPDQALAKLTTLSFNPDAVARMAFWIADAPHHVGYESVMVETILDAQRLGVHLYPVAASGSNNLVEYTMRTAAQVTGGRYLFLTDDSGIGGSHQEPTIPCYFVTTLGRAMVRMAAMELTGRQVDVASADVLRTAGDPVAGRCTLASGTVLQAL